MSIPGLDLERLWKCIGLMRRGATPGERSAAMAAASRVAAASGLSLEEAVLRLDCGAARPVITGSDTQPSAPGRAPMRAKPPKPKPPTLAEVIAERERMDVARRAYATRHEKRLRKLYAQQEKQQAADRAAQAIRDQEWAEARGRCGQPNANQSA
ncbi:hypothetical protein MKK55_10185 [Methylobacterium sp. J-059]|uniref:hypothetical protein n=1 Tax=Methylobacterium sp. J-059 TaxID=2836643 RepID=UPI001FBB8EC3|nr:hypothetical protein [Methylobacterium sp. J-059]MCJ2039304.1 hypothetical protein [Methylobacterium sp. J-059]